MASGATPNTRLVKRRSATPPAVLCLEGEWEKSDPLDRLSIEPSLHLLELQRYMRLVHRNVNTVEELDYHIAGMTHRRRRRYEVLYLAFHGSATGIDLGSSTVSLTDLADKLRHQDSGFVVYFASCGVLDAEPTALKTFCRESGAKAIAGYTRDVDWIESAAFELLMLSSLLETTNTTPLHDRMVREHPRLTTKLGFRMAHSTWASELGS